MNDPFVCSIRRELAHELRVVQSAEDIRNFQALRSSRRGHAPATRAGSPDVG